MAVKFDVRVGHDIAYVTRGHAAGHSVEMLRRVYAGRPQGLEGVWITRMDQTLPQDKP